MEKGIQKLATRKQMRRIVDLLCAGRINRAAAATIIDQYAPSRLKDNHVTVFVDYTMPRDRESLEAAFSEDGVSGDFFWKEEWEPLPSCVGVDRTPGERTFFLKCFNRWTNSHEVLDAVGDAYRPALPEEAYALSLAHPRLQLRRYMVALGAKLGPERLVTVLSSRSGKRQLLTKMFEVKWDADVWFLFIRKDAA